MATIAVRNLPIDAKPETLRRIFSQYGQVSNVRLSKTSGRKKKRSYGIVEMPKRTEASRAVRRLNGQYFRGLFMWVEETPNALQ